MNIEDARKRLLIYAVDRLGRDETARRLSTSVSSLNGWMDGTTEPPNRAILALADLVYEMQKTAVK